MKTFNSTQKSNSSRRLSEREKRKKQMIKDNFIKPNVRTFLDSYFIQSSNNIIRKAEFLRYFNIMNKSNVPWNWLLTELKKNGIICIDGGLICGLDYKDDILGLSFDFEFS